MADRKHWADVPILRDLLWFLVLPHQAKQWLAKQTPAGVDSSRGGKPE
jgi:hypothetical protein